jgi:hypothetical protein
MSFWIFMWMTFSPMSAFRYADPISRVSNSWRRELPPRKCVVSTVGEAVLESRDSSCRWPPATRRAFTLSAVHGLLSLCR